MPAIDIRLFELKLSPEVYALWRRISGLWLRALDGSPEGVARFINRNPQTSFLAYAAGALVG